MYKKINKQVQKFSPHPRSTAMQALATCETMSVKAQMSMFLKELFVCSEEMKVKAKLKAPNLWREERRGRRRR